MVLGSELQELFNDSKDEAKILAFQLEALNNPRVLNGIRPPVLNTIQVYGD